MKSQHAHPTKEKLEELESQTNDTFTKLLINDLKKRVHSVRAIGFYETVDFNRILNLIEKEKNNKKLKEINKKQKDNVHFNLKVHKISYGKKAKGVEVKGNTLLSKLSKLIQKEFYLEPGHLHEFQIGKFKFGPECDEWQEDFDSLDNFRLDAAITASGLKAGNFFKFRYDFGDNIKFKIEIAEILKNEQ